MLKLMSGELIGQYLDPGRLSRYLDEVEAANRGFGLYSKNLSRDDLLVLVAESLLPVRQGWIGTRPVPILDIGSGWGIPSVPLLLSGLEHKITMVERSRKKADFLMLVLHRLGVTADVVCEDIRSWKTSDRYALVMIRGVSLEARLLKKVKGVAQPVAELIYFGPAAVPESLSSVQFLEYQIDNLPVRIMAKAKIF